MKNCTSCETEQHHSLRFMFVSGLTTILLVSGLGVEDRQKCLCEVPILLHVTFFLFLRILAKGEVYPSKQEHFMNWNNKFEVFFFSSCSSWRLIAKCRACVFQVAEVCAERGSLRWNLTVNDSEWALKWCMNCSSIAFRLGDTVYVFILQ
jgi:hypothetical protein